MTRKQISLPEAEKQWAGSVLNADEAQILNGLGLVREQTFVNELVRSVYRAVVDLTEHRQHVSLASIGAHMEARGSARPLTDLTTLPWCSGEELGTLGFMLREYEQRRRYETIARALDEKARDASEDVFETEGWLLSHALGDVDDLGQHTSSMDDSLKDAFNDIAEAGESHGVVGVPTGLASLDRVIQGYKNGTLTVLCAPTGSGKTMWGLKSARHAAVYNQIPVLYIGVEMKRGDIATRLLIAESRVHASRVTTGRFTEDEQRRLTLAREALRTAPIQIDRTPGLTIEQVVMKVRKFGQQRRLRGPKSKCLVVIDYLQQIDGSSLRAATSEREIAGMSRTLVTLATEENLPILALSQVTVKCAQEKRQPTELDIRGSGDVANNADVVLTLWRPEKAGIEFDKELGIATDGLARLYAAKVRHGRSKLIEARFEEEFFEFKDAPPRVRTIEPDPF